MTLNRKNNNDDFKKVVVQARTKQETAMKEKLKDTQKTVKGIKLNNFSPDQN